MALVTDPSVKPVVDQVAVKVNKILEKLKIEDEIEPLRVTDDHTVKDQLYQLLSDYKVPSMTNIEYNEYAQLVQSDIRNRYLAKKEHYKRLNETLIDSTLEDLKSMRNIIVNRDGAQFGYNFLENKYFEEPLENKDEKIDLDDFEQEIKYYDDSSNLNISASIKCLLKRAEAKGLSVELLKRLFHKFGSRYIPDLKANLDAQVQKDHVYPIFNCLVEYIDIEREKTLIKAARSKIQRKVGEDIQIVTDKLKNIIYQQISIQNPTLNDVKVKESTDKLVVGELKYFVTEEAFAQLDKRVKVKLGVGGTPDLTEFIRDVKDIENSQPNLRPKQILMAPIGDDGTLAVAVASAEAKVNQVSSYEDNRKSRDRTPRSDRRRFSGGRFNQGKRDWRSRSRSRSSGRDFSRNNSQSRFRRKSPYQKYNKRDSRKDQKRDRQGFRDRQRSSSAGNYSSSPAAKRSHSPFSSKRDSSPFQRKSRSQNYGNNRRRSFSGSSASRDSSFPRRNRDRRGNSGSRNNSPANHQRKDSAKYNKVSYCSACGSNTHTQNSCFRYPETSKVTEPCSYCLKNGRRLYHQYQYCCYCESKYKSPNRNGSKN